LSKFLITWKRGSEGMRYALILVGLLVGLTGCGVEWIGSMPDCYHGRSTTIGVDVGLPEGLSLVIGYKQHEGLICKDETNALITSESKATVEGLEVKQVTAFGGAAIPVSEVSGR